MVAWSSMLVVDGSNGSTCSEDSAKTLVGEESLQCYVCNELYTRPRILPCGHTYCADCVAQLRDSAAREYNQHRDRNAHRRGDCGFFTCPMPGCHYSMKLMNVGRWSLKNKAAADAVAHLKKKKREQIERGTQTEIGLDKVIIALPRSVFSNAKPPLKPEPTLPLSTVVLDQVVQRAFSTDSLNRQTSISENNSSWRSYMAMIGMQILEQVFTL